MPLATVAELLRHPPLPLPQWIVDRNLLPCPEYQIQFTRAPGKSGAPGEPYWTSNYGAQTWVLVSPFDETMIGGERGGAKSAALIAWFAMGDASLSEDDPARYSFLLESSYRGLMLRKEYQSMAEFVDEAMEFFGPLGGEPKDDPVVFNFGSGAKVYTNHLGDKNAFEKYRGWGVSRIGIEELGQIENVASYKKLLGSLRGKKQVRIHGKKVFPALRSQIMSTANPDGPGKPWIKKRFVKVLDDKGILIPPNRQMRDEITGLTRIFIPMRRLDNPYLRDNKQYEGYLLDQDEATRKAWMEGNWDSDSGTFFGEWRPEGPVGAEEMQKYPWARHVIPAADLKPWWFRFGGGDWGYDHPAVFHKFCRSERDGRIHAYDELTLRQVGSYEMGVRLASWWLPDLEYLPDKSVTIAFSHDAFSTGDDTRTKAEQIAAGINSVLGPYGAFLLKFTDDERKAAEDDPGYANRMFDRHRTGAGSQAKFFIVLKPASRDTVARWNYMHELLRFRPARQETEEELKQRLIDTFNRAGSAGDSSGAVLAYERELSKVKRPENATVLPRLQVWKGRCPGLVRCMEEANKDEDHPEKIKKWDAVEGVGGDDPLESCFIAGTMIETEFGPKPIELLAIGDMVQTRDGLRAVMRSGMTSTEACVITAHFSNGAAITGTKNHPIFVNGTFCRLDSLKYGDTVETWPSAKRSYLTALNSGGIRSHQDGTFETITPREETTVSAGSERFTRRFGFPSMDPSRTAVISTTKMRILSITTRAISKLNPASSIIPSTQELRKVARGFAPYSPWDRRRPRHGINLKLAGYGGLKTANALSRCVNWLRNHATHVGRLTRLNGPIMPSFALAIASKNGDAIMDSTTSTSAANFAERFSGVTNSKKSGSAVVHALRLGVTGQAPVYNLAVSGKPEYYANGILVHNCGHGLHHFKEVETSMPKSYFVSERMSQIQDQYVKEIGEELTDPTRLMMVQRTQANRFDIAHRPAGRSFNVPRAGSRRHRVN